MGRGVSSGGGESSLGYLFGHGSPPKPTDNAEAPQNPEPVAVSEPPQKAVTAASPVDITKQVPAGIQGNKTNNYFRADGQNSGNFLTV